MNQPEPIHSLIARATPGPWTTRQSARPVDGEYDYSINGGNNPVFAECFGRDAKGGRPDAVANAQLIARCSPATLRVVVEALEVLLTDSELTWEVMLLKDPSLKHVPRPTAHAKGLLALNLLNGHATANGQGEA